MARLALAHVAFALSVSMVAAASSGFLNRACAGPQFDFGEFVQVHGRSYNPAEYATRLAIYDQNARSVREQNCKMGRRWTAAINKFSDWKNEELMMTFGELGARGSPQQPLHEGAFVQETQDLSSSANVPSKLDWSHLNATKDVLDQGPCGSCWAVGTSTLLRAHVEIAEGKDPGRFALQQLVSCVPNENKCGGSGGCHGSTTELALKYVLRRGLMKESEFPYETSDWVECPSDAQITQKELDDTPSTLLQQATGAKIGSSTALRGLIGYNMMEPNKYSSLMKSLQTGPAKVSIGVPDGFHMYSSGVMEGCPLDAVLTHAALVIGYGEEEDGAYWLLQNSWGLDWGDKGHFKFARRSATFEEGSQGCGVDNEPLKGNGCAAGPNKSPDSIPVCGMCGILNNVVVPIFKKK